MQQEIKVERRTTKVVFCLPGNSYTRGFFDSWVKLDGYLKGQGIEAVVSTAGGSNVSKVRERCVRPFKPGSLHPNEPFYGEIDYDYIMWIDSDIIFNPEDFQKLLDKDLDIVAGLYNAADGNFACRIVDDSDGKTKQVVGPVEAEWVGMGFMLMKRGVLEAITPPWFQTTVVDGQFLTEDIYFCYMARNAGIKVYVDPNVVVKHVKELII